MTYVISLVFQGSKILLEINQNKKIKQKQTNVSSLHLYQ